MAPNPKKQKTAAAAAPDDDAAKAAVALYNKFKVDIHDAELNFGSLDVFLGGLDEKIGAPQVASGSDGLGIFNSMKQEHAELTDSRIPFIDEKDKKRTSIAEWWFVIDHNKSLQDIANGKTNELAEVSGPNPRKKDSLLALLKPNSSHTDLGSIGSVAKGSSESLEQRMNAKNIELSAEDLHTSQRLILEEAIAGRLYTGVMYNKYNALRGCSEHDPPPQRQLFRERCLGNRYSTTIHACNSLIVKTSRLTQAQVVYRGLSGAKAGVPPEQFFKKNRFGVSGGIEFAFLSTSTNHATAVDFADTEEAAPMVFHMQMGMVDRGADVKWCSQAPTEAEILFGPLTGIEVLEFTKGTGKLDGVMIIKTRPSINLRALTLEDVISRRRKLLIDMAEGLRIELRAALVSEAMPAKAAEAIETAFQSSLEDKDKGGPLSYSPHVYSDEKRFQQELTKVIDLKARIMQPGTRAPILASFGKVASPGGVASGVATNTSAAAASSSSSSSGAASSSSTTIITPAALELDVALTATHRQVLLKSTDADASGQEQISALRHLTTALESEAMRQDVPAFLSRLRPYDATCMAMTAYKWEAVQEAACQALLRVPVDTLEANAPTLVSAFAAGFACRHASRSNDTVSQAVASVVARLSSEALTAHAAGLMKRYIRAADASGGAASGGAASGGDASEGDAIEDLIYGDEAVLQKIEQATLAQHVLTIAGSTHLRMQSLGYTFLKGHLDAKALATAAPQLLAAIEPTAGAGSADGGDASAARHAEVAALVMALLDPPDLATHAAALARAMRHPNTAVAHAALRTLLQVPPLGDATELLDMASLDAPARIIVMELARHATRAFELGPLPPPTHGLIPDKDMEGMRCIISQSVVGETVPPQVWHETSDLLGRSWRAALLTAVQQLGLGLHAVAALQQLASEDDQVRSAASRALESLTSDQIAPHTKELLAFAIACNNRGDVLGTSREIIVPAAAALLGRLTPAVLCPHLQTLVRRMSKACPETRTEARPPMEGTSEAPPPISYQYQIHYGLKLAVETLAKLPPSARAAKEYTEIFRALLAFSLEAGKRGDDYSESAVQLLQEMAAEDVHTFVAQTIGLLTAEADKAARTPADDSGAPASRTHTAANALRRLTESMVTPHADALIQCLEAGWPKDDTSILGRYYVTRFAVLRALARTSPAVRIQHLPRLCRLEDAAREVLNDLPPEALADEAAKMVGLLGETKGGIIATNVAHLLPKVEPASVLVNHMATLVELLKTCEPAAKKVFRALAENGSAEHARLLHPHVDAIAVIAVSTHANSRYAVDVLASSAVPVAMRATHAAALVPKLTNLADAYEPMRVAILTLVGTLTPTEVANYRDALERVTRDDRKTEPRCLAVAALGKMPAAAIVQSLPALVRAVDDAMAGVQKNALTALTRLSKAELRGSEALVQKVKLLKANGRSSVKGPANELWAVMMKR